MNRINQLSSAILALLLTVLMSNSIFAQNPSPDTQPKILDLLLAPQHQKAFSLTPAVRTELHELQMRRSKLFVELYAKDTPQQQAIANQPFQKQTEQMALSLLTVSQRSVVNQIQLKNTGLQSLLRPEIRATLSLSEKQLMAIRELGQQRVSLSRGATDDEQHQLSQIIERRMFAQLTTKQQRSWLRLTGTP